MAFYNFNVPFRYLSSDSSRTASRCHPRKTFLLAALLAAILAITIAATGAVLHAGDPGQVIVLNPKSYPLVGGTWAVDLDVLEGGDLRVAAGEGTAFGRDIEFAGMHGGDGSSMTPLPAGHDLRFGDVPAGYWTLEVRVLTDGPHHLLLEMGGQTHYASNTAEFADVTSTTTNGTYGSGDTIDVRVSFSEAVSLGTFGIRENGTDGSGGTFNELDGAFSVTTTTEINSKHYALVASQSDSGVQIIDITDPENPTAVASVTDSTDYPELFHASSVTTTEINSKHYALVAAASDDGVQIINITDPETPTAVTGIDDTEGTDELLLDGAYSITTTEIDSKHYALVAARWDDGVQIINITDPETPTAVAGIEDTEGTDELLLDGAYSITTTEINSKHYALVASRGDNGVQIIDITDPGNSTAVAGIIDGTVYTELEDAVSVTTTKIGSKHYALVAAYADSGVQIIDITTPESPTAIFGIADGPDYPVLGGALSITTTEINSKHYALVAAYDDDGVQIIDITIPASPIAVASITGGTDYPELKGAASVTTTKIGSKHYALVASFTSNGVQIIDITDPAHPFNPLLPYVELDLAGDRRATYTGLEDSDKSLVFGYEVRPGDRTTDLAYSGTDSLNLGHSTLTDTDDSTDLSGVTLPDPGSAHSLSHNKDITLSDPAAFVTTWRTMDGPDEITLPISGSDMTVHWGDGSTTAALGPVSHTYGTAGDYTIQVTGGLERFHLNRAPDASKLISLDQWGNTTWTTMDNAFRGAKNMVYNAADSPDLSSVESMFGMFASASAFNGDISSWNVSAVTNMSNMFAFASAFNGNISSWDVSAVTDTSDMFNTASAFNGDISSWNVSAVTDMSNMFNTASAFNGDISSWDVSAVIYMSGTFSAPIFNGDISSWNVSAVIDMSRMFNSASVFNGNISSWDVSLVDNMSRMFDGASVFNGNISSWDVSLVDDMSRMFSRASAFNQTLSSWNVSAVTDMSRMFNNASVFNGNISSWDVSSATDMSRMFNSASAFNGDLSSWDVSLVDDMTDMFDSALSFVQNLGNWYVTLDSDTIAGADIPGVVGTISAQNLPLNGHSPTYGIVDDLDADYFEIVSNRLNMTSGVPGKAEYSINVTAFGGNVFESGNHWRLLEIEVTGQITDTTAPVITLRGSASVTVEANNQYTDAGADCLDGVVAITPIITVNTVDITQVEIYTVTYSCTDASGNNATPVSRTVTVEDTTPPVITLRGSASVTVEANNQYTDAGADCLDGVDGNRTPIPDSTVDITQVEIYTVTYSCTDASGNNATPVSRTVTVEDTTPPPSDNSSPPPSDNSSPPPSDTTPPVTSNTDRSSKSRSNNTPNPLTTDNSIIIDGQSHDLGSGTATINPYDITTGQAIDLVFTAYSPSDIVRFTVYLNLHGDDIEHSDSDTYIRYDHGVVQIVDPHGFISDASITITEDSEQFRKKIISTLVEFNGNMGLTNMAVYIWNEDRRYTSIRVFNALNITPGTEMLPNPEPGSVLPADPEPVVPDFAGDVVDPEPIPYDILGPDDYDEAQVLHIIRMWSGFESEFITDEQMLTSLEFDYLNADIPDWVMTELGVLVSNGDVTTDEFMLALQYVLENL